MLPHQDAVYVTCPRCGVVHRKDLGDHRCSPHRAPFDDSLGVALVLGGTLVYVIAMLSRMFG